MGQDQFGIAKGEAGERVWRNRHYGLGKRQEGVNEDIETGNDLLGGFKAEPASSRIFKAFDSPLRLDRISSGWTFKKAFVCLIR